MSTIHISTGDGNSASYDQDQLRAMWSQGILRADTVYWIDGMSEWRPLQELFAPYPSTPPPVPTSRPYTPKGSSFQFTKDPTALTKTVKIMVWIQLGAGILNMLSDIAQMSLASSGSISPAAAEANDSRQAIIGGIYFLVFVATAIVFLKWIYRANLNCRGFGATDMRFTPGWSIGYYFIPFLNLVRPYQAMKEIWKVSTNPLNWKDQAASALLGWWWALWLTSGIFGQLSFRMSMKVTSPSSLEAATAMAIASGLADIPLCIVAIALINAIYQKQRNLVDTGV